MSALAAFLFVYLSAHAVWESTEQRPGTLDELRALAAAVAALVILSGLGLILAL